ncbi:MAG: TetR/AcrR family transcriptional regulator [Pseudomonadota bacterium]
MAIKDDQLAQRALAYFKQVQGARMPANIGLDEVRALIDQLTVSTDPERKELQIEQLIEVMRSFVPDEDERDPKVRKRRRIVQAATELFVKNGYRKTSIDDVARRAHVAKGTVYLYFKNKPALLMQAITDEKMRMAEAMQRSLGAPMAPREKLRAWLDVYFKSLQQMPLVARMIGGDREVLLALEEIDDAFQLDTMAIQHDFVARMIEAAASPQRLPEEQLQGRARVLLAQLYSAGALFDERVRGGLDVERYGQLLVDVLIDGVVGPSKEHMS